MSYRTTSHASHLRHQSLAPSNTLSASSQSSVLQQRINEKRVELENLKQLRDLSAGLAGQMGQLEEKLSTLSNGTEAVAAVLSNWHNVLRAIHMASASIAKPKGAEDSDGSALPLPLPQTLVRIPMQDIQPASDPLETNEDESGIR